MLFVVVVVVVEFLACRREEAVGVKVGAMAMVKRCIRFVRMTDGR